MEYQKIKNLLDHTPNPQSKFRTKYWVEISDDSRGPYNTNSQIKFKTTSLSQVYVIIVMHTYLLKELYQLQIQQTQK